MQTPLHPDQRIAAFARLGDWLGAYLSGSLETREQQAFDTAVARAGALNPWFSEAEIRNALAPWSRLLRKKAIGEWLQPYAEQLQPEPRVIGVVNAGNIPLVGFHDLASVLLSGHRYLGKNASDDTVLLPFLAEQLAALEPGFAGSIRFAEKLSGFDAVIATGSNNTARYFEYYFSKVPHIIRRNKNGVAVLDGTETEAEMEALAVDVFRYYGLGCRNVSRMLLPRDYDFSKLFEGFESFADLRTHHKYMSNYDYYRAILALKKVPFLDNGFVIVKNAEETATPISVVNYGYYDTPGDADRWLETHQEEIQCIVSRRHIPFGQAQEPGWADYADGVDTVRFLADLAPAG